MRLRSSDRCVAAVLAATSLSIGGCSWIGMARPPKPPVEPAPPAACTTSRLAPALDTAGAVLIGVPAVTVTAVAIATPACNQGGGWDCLFQFPTPGAKAGAIVLGLAFVGLAVVDTVSAVNGFDWANDCQAIQARQLACVSGAESSCVALRTGPAR